MKTRTLFFALLVVTACQTSTTMTEAEMMDIAIAMGRKFEEGVKTRDFDMIMSIYADSAFYVQDDGPIRRGQTEIRKQWRNDVLVFGMQSLRLTPLFVQGDRKMFYEIGTATSDFKQADTSFIFRAKYTNVWVLKSNGAYQLQVDMYNQLTYED